VPDTRYIYTLRARHSDETLREADRNCLLLRAAAQGQLPRVQHLLRLGADVDFADDSGFTALHHAVSSGFEDCVQELINQGADINIVTNCGVALNIAADRGRSHVAEILLRARADREEAIAFAEGSGADVEELQNFLAQAIECLSPENQTAADSVAAIIHSETRTESTDTDANVGEKDVSASVDDSHNTRPGDRNGEVDTRTRAFRANNITQTSNCSPEQASSLGGLFRMLTGAMARKRSNRGTSQVRGSLGLTTLHTPSQDTVAHLVFVHGAGGSSQGTWMCDDDPSTFWPLEWLPNHIGFRDTAIHTFGYNNDPVPVMPVSRSGEYVYIQNVAQSLLQCIAYHEVLKKNDKVSSDLACSQVSRCLADSSCVGSLFSSHATLWAD
jgi:ankyrin repeat protein